MKKRSGNRFGALIALFVVASVFWWVFYGNGTEVFSNLTDNFFRSFPSLPPSTNPSPADGATSPTNSYGTLMVTAPNNNNIYVDGRLLGKGVLMTNLVPGTYMVYFRDASTDKLTWQGTAVVNAGKTTRIKISGP